MSLQTVWDVLANSKGEWYFTPSIAPSIKKIDRIVGSPPVNSDVICGDCGRPQTNHPFPFNVNEPWTDVCFRDPFDWGYPYLEYKGEVRSDYYKSTGLAYVPDYDNSTQDEYEPNTWETELAALDRWHDKATTDDGEYYCTLTLEQHQQNPKVTEAVTVKTPTGYAYKPADTNLGHLTPEQTNVYIESTSGFVARQLLDPVLTEKYQRRLLNAFINKAGNLQIGSVILTTNSNNEVIATCINNKCNVKDERGNYVQRTITLNGINPNDPLNGPTRDYMERQVYSIIQHGNEHAAKWYTSRDTYYHLSPVLSEPTTPVAIQDRYSDQMNDKDRISFLFDHYRFCQDSNCKCNEWLDKYGFSNQESAA
jgi:hypothetical protein